MEEEKVRLYVGGLGSQVGSDDLQERFAPLGQVQSISVPPAKAGPGHRGFAYVDFVPATHASLRNLFSAYNGCKWRGGVLRIEKAKEHFTDRLQREWTEEAASLTTTHVLASQVETVQQSLLVSDGHNGAGSKGDIEANGLKIFFPRLKKLRTVPFTGLGKHKRSFQRVESSPLHLLSTCACDESLRSGSCDCSKMNSDSCSLKADKCPESDDISRAIDIERKTQLDLLSRLFPSDIASTSLEIEEAVEIDDSDVKEMNEEKGSAKCAEKLFSEPTLVPIANGKRKSGRLKHMPQSSETRSMFKKQNVETMEIGVEDDPISHSVAKERAKQLELVHKLFPADAPFPRESEQGLQPENNEIMGKRKRKREVIEKSSDMVKAMSKFARSRSTKQLQETDLETIPVQQLEEHPKLNMEPDNSTESSSEMTVNISGDFVPLATSEVEEGQILKRIPTLLTDDLLDDDSEMILNIGDDFVPVAFAEEQEKQILKSLPAVAADDLSQEDTEMVLNLGDDSLSLAVAEEQEKHMMKSLSVMADESLQKSSEMTVCLQDDSLSLVTAEDRITLNLGDEQERHVHRGLLPLNTPSTSDHGGVIHYKGARVLDTRIAEVAEDSEDKVDLDNKDDSVDNEDYSEPMESKKAEASMQRSDVKASMGQQPVDASKRATLAELCQFRETEAVMQSIKIEAERSMQAAGSREEDKPSNPAPLVQDDNRKIEQQIDVDSNRGKELDDTSKSGKKLTRAAWKSLVGETGRVVFSLHQVTGSRPPDLPSIAQEIQTVEDRPIQGEPMPSSKKTNKIQAKIKLPVSPTEKKKRGIGSSSAQLKVNAAELNTTPIGPLVVSSGDCCPFMKSENAEKEWLATKSELRSDYRAKHKHAARHMKKLWGKRS